MAPLDSAGNIYISDNLNFLVFRVSPTGIVSVFAGNGFDAVRVGDGGDARSAAINRPNTVGVAPDGSIYIGESFSIRKVAPDGTISTFAGGNSAAFGGDGGPAAKASIQVPLGIIFDSAGNLFFSDLLNNRVRKIDTNGIITTVAGNGQAAFSGDGGPATNASLSAPRGLRFDAAGNLYIADSNFGRIRKVAPDGTISTFAGGGNTLGDNGPATQAQLSAPAALDFDAAGNMYVLESNGPRVRRISTSGTITTIAGSGLGFSGDGGPASKATFRNPLGLTVDRAGNILVADTQNGRVRRIKPDGTINTIAGNGLYRFSPEGTQATLAFLKAPTRVAVAPDGRVYINDAGDSRIRRVETDGRLTTFAGTGESRFVPLKSPAPALSTPLFFPEGMAFDAKGNLYYSEAGSVRRVTPDGAVTVYAGGGANNPGDGGPAINAVVGGPKGLTFDSAGSLYIADTATHRIRKVTPDGIISTVAGAGVAGFLDGPAAQAQFNTPFGLAIDSAANVYVADSQNFRIRKITPDGNVSTYAGTGMPFPVGDGSPATLGSFNNPTDVAFDAAGNLLVMDQFHFRVRRISGAGIISTIAGNGAIQFAGDGGPAQNASLNNPTGLAVNKAGDIFIADTSNFRVRVIPALAPTFNATPATLSFTVKAGDAPPQPQQITLTSSVAGLPYTIAINGDWLMATASSTSTPATVSVTVNPARLAPGDYQGSITFTPTLGGVAPVTTSVTLTVLPAAPSLLAVDTKGLAFSFVRGGAASNRRVLVLNGGGGIVNFTASAKTNSGGAWLSISPAQGSATGGAPVSLTVTADPTGLNAGTYSGTITIADAAGTTTIPIPVTMTISVSGQSIRLSQVGLTFTAVVNGGATPPQSVAVVNTGQGLFQFTATAITAPGSPSWLSVSPSSGSSDVSQPVPILTVSVNPAGLTAGFYFGRVEVRSPSADNSPQEITVVLNLLADGTDPGPVVQPAGLVFTGVAGGGDPSSQTVLVSNLTANPISFGSGVATLDGGKYIAYQPSNATVQPGSLRIVVQPSFGRLGPGIYRGAITLVFSDGSIRTIAILIVLAPPGATIGGAHEAAGCTPTRLLPLITSLGDQFNIPASFPTSIEVRVVDDCGNPTTTGSVVSTFSNGDPALSLTSLRDGRWATTWLNRNTAQRQVSVTVTAEIAQQQLRGSVQTNGGLSGDNSPPIIGAGGVVSASSLAGQAPLAPGAMVSIFGAKLSLGTAAAQLLPLDIQLAGTTVLVAGKSLPLLFSSDGQVNALLPFDIPVNARIQMLVSRGAQISVPEEISIAPAQPGIYTANGSGSGQGDIFVVSSTGTQRLADIGAPAKAGDVVVIYCSGLGAVDQPVLDGAPAPSSPLARTVNPATVTIGGMPANVFFAGLAPNFSGLYQINAFVPAGVSAGDQVPVVINIAGQASPPVTMSVR